MTSIAIKKTTRKSGQPARRTSRRRGGSLLEMALVLAILFNICYGTIEFGYYFFVKNTLEGAAREGCRAGIVAGATNANVVTAAQAVLTAAGLTTSQVTIQLNGSTITSSDSTLVSTEVAVGSNLTIAANATWGTIGSGFRPLAIIGSSKVVAGSTVMRKEG